MENKLHLNINDGQIPISFTKCPTVIDFDVRWRRNYGYNLVVFCTNYCDDTIKSVMASQIISPTIVYSRAYSDADQRKHQSSASLAFVRGIHRWSVNTLHKGPVTRTIVPFDDVIIFYWYRKSSKQADAIWHHSVNGIQCRNIIFSIQGGKARYSCKYVPGNFPAREFFMPFLYRDFSCIHKLKTNYDDYQSRISI